MTHLVDPTELTAMTSGTPRTHRGDTRAWIRVAQTAGHADVVLVGLPRDAHLDQATGGHLGAHVRIGGTDYVIVTARTAGFPDSQIRQVSARLPLAGELDLFDRVLAVAVTASRSEQMTASVNRWVRTAREAELGLVELTGLPVDGFHDRFTGGRIAASIRVGDLDYVLVLDDSNVEIDQVLVYARPMLEHEESLFEAAKV